MKKFVSVLLALAMTLALSVSALAAGNGTITVDNPKANETYTAYKIFDVSYNADKTAYSYTIKSDSAWFATVKSFADIAANGLTLTEAAGTPGTYVVTTDKFSAPEFAKALQTALKDNATLKATGIALEAKGDGTVSKDNLDLGYYFVSSDTGALCNLTTTNPTVTIHDKNDIPFDKVDDKESVDVGEVVTYTITGKVPDTTGFTSYTYKFTDTMSEGLTFQKDIVVKIGNTDVTSACTITYTPSAEAATGFEVTIPVMNYQNQVGAAITVTYTAIVNEHAVATVEKNHATLTYSNDPTNSESKTTTPPDEETVYSAKIVIDKYAANKDNAEDTSKKLAGAQFVLYKMDGTNKLYYKWNTTTEKVEWVERAKADVVTTDGDGAAFFAGIADGTYYLEEIAAPAGYNLLKDPVEVTVAGSKTEIAKLTVTEQVANSTGTELPSTGGMGTTIFYVLGGVLMAGAFVLLVVRKRMRTE